MHFRIYDNLWINFREEFATSIFLTLYPVDEMHAVDAFACIACDYRRGHVIPELWSAKAIDSHLIPEAFEAEVAFTAMNSS